MDSSIHPVCIRTKTSIPSNTRLCKSQNLLSLILVDHCQPRLTQWSMKTIQKFRSSVRHSYPILDKKKRPKITKDPNTKKCTLPFSLLTLYHGPWFTNIDFKVRLREITDLLLVVDLVGRRIRSIGSYYYQSLVVLLVYLP